MSDSLRNEMVSKHEAFIERIEKLRHKEAEKNTAIVLDINNKISLHHDDIINLQSDFKYMRKDLSEIKEILKKQDEKYASKTSVKQLWAIWIFVLTIAGAIVVTDIVEIIKKLW